MISIERLRPLHDKARDNLAPLRRDNLRLVYGDGRLGHAPNAPYDAIICAAGGEDLPPAWLEQLAVGGALGRADAQPTRASGRCWWWSTAARTAGHGDATKRCTSCR